MMRERLMRCTFANKQEYQCYRENVHQCIEDALDDSPKDQLTMVEIAINEAINNAFKYGSGNYNPIIISIYLFDSNYLFIRIKDKGNGFCVENLISQFDANCCEDDMEWQWGESGRGLFIMQSVMDQVHYNAKGNAVSLIKNVQKLN